MECDRYELLYKIARISNDASVDFPRSCKRILRYLSEAFSLEEASFLLFDPGARSFHSRLTASGAGFFESDSTRASTSVERAALHSRTPQPEGIAWHFPLVANDRNLGVLSLTPSADRTDLPLQALRLASEEIARVIHADLTRQNESRHRDQLSLLTELSRELSSADLVRDLLEATLATLVRHLRVSCAIARPLYGGALIGSRYLCTAPETQTPKSSFLDLEECYGLRALEGKNPAFFRIPESEDSSSAPMWIAVIPLLFNEVKLGAITLIQSDRSKGIALTPGTESKRFLAAVGKQVSLALDRAMGRERFEELSIENDRKLQEATLLYRISRAMHSTLRINELIHLILSSAVIHNGGGFERAMLFMINEKTDTLQGMLCVTRQTASHVFPSPRDFISWAVPQIGEAALEAQRQAPCCRLIMKQRLPLAGNHPLARAVQKDKVILVSNPLDEEEGGDLAEVLQLAPYAVAPLLGKNRPLGVLLVDNPDSGEAIGPDRRRFLELFASQASAALENSMLLHRLETAHQDLRETQERLIQGEKMAVLGEMAASVAHELRNPLVPIGGFAERLARMVTVGSREHEYASIITREVRRMEEMLANILAFSKKQMLCFSKCRVTDIIEDSLSLEADALDRYKITVIREIEGGLPLLQCDEKKLRQVLINLITNARQAMHEGGRLAIRAYASTLRGEAAITLEVEDSGGGIPTEVLHNIFNPFFTTKEKGTGLGLSISHRIIEHHSGEIEVRNTSRGVIFIISLPIAGNQPSH